MELGERIRREIELSGPMPVSRYMALANAHYYATRVALGRDFVTAPEVSQTFGELIGLWLADLWLRAGSPAHLRLVELGPGRGTLMADLLRATRGVPGWREAVSVHLVETSAALRAEQAARLAGARWHETLDEVPADAPLMLVANEFLDVMPVRQLVRAGEGWRERMVGLIDGKLAAVLGHAPMDALVAPAFAAAEEGSCLELQPAATAMVSHVGAWVAERGGAALFVDYGHGGPALGDTLQAVRGHRYADPFAEPGEADLTVHVDFGAVARAAREAGARVHGPVEQGAFLTALGIGARAERLAAGAEQPEAVRAGVERLVGPDAMGRLFKVLAVVAPDWPEPAGFAP